MKADIEGGGKNMSSLHAFILNSKCAKIVWRPGCARTRKGILSVPLDSQRHSGRLEKEQSLTPLAAVMCVLQLGGRGRNTDRNRKGELEGGVGIFYFKHFVQEIFMSKCTKKHWRPGSARTQLGSLRSP